MSSPPGSKPNFFYRYTALRLNVKGLKVAKVAHMYEKMSTLVINRSYKMIEGLTESGLKFQL